MELELDLWRHLLNCYTKFQIDIANHVEQKPEKLRQNSENKIFFNKKPYVQKYAAGNIRTKYEGSILIYEAMIAKNEFDLLWTVN